MLNYLPEELKKSDIFGDYIGLEFTQWQEGYSQCVLHADKHLLNPNGKMHGGALYTMADSSMGATVFSVLSKNETCATIEIKIAYFKAVASGLLTCDTKILNMGNRIVTLESEITNDGALIAKAIGTFFIFTQRQEPD